MFFLCTVLFTYAPDNTHHHIEALLLVELLRELHVLQRRDRDHLAAGGMQKEKWNWTVVLEYSSRVPYGLFFQAILKHPDSLPSGVGPCG